MSTKDKPEGVTDDLLDRICHKEQLGIWADEIASALALSDFLKEDWTFDDSVDLSKEIAAQLRDIIASALTHPEFNVTEALASHAALPSGVRVKAEDYDHLKSLAETAEREANDPGWSIQTREEYRKNAELWRRILSALEGEGA